MKKSFKTFAIPLAAIVGLLLIIAWMAGLFSEKIQPGISAPLPGVTGDPVPVAALEVIVIEKVPASVEATQATLISSRSSS